MKSLHGVLLYLKICFLFSMAWVGTSLASGITFKTEADLRRFFVQDCGSCHGMTMKGGLGKPLRPEFLRNVTDEALFLKIKEGVPGTAMPPWKALLSDQDIKTLVKWMRDEPGPTEHKNN